MPAKIATQYGSAMPSIYSSGLEPDPTDAVDVLAFVLCPVRVFAPTGDPEELAAAAELLGSAKAEAVRRWLSAHSRQKRN